MKSGAAATGVREKVVKTLGGFLIVELMRQGKSPQEACEEAVNRIVTKDMNYKNFQIGYIAINKKGETGSYCIQPEFTYRTYSEKRSYKYTFKFFYYSIRFYKG